MKIEKRILNRNSWYEDEDCNEIIMKENDVEIPANAKTYHSLFPLEITEHIYDVSSGKFKWMIDSNCHIGKGNEKIIMNMVNSGDYTLCEALLLWSQSCERCMNVLSYKYTNGEEGYEEFSEEWKKCGTKCRFCDEVNE